MSTADAPSGQICNLCDIYELAGAKNRAEKAFRGPEHGPGTSQRLSALCCLVRSRAGCLLGRVCVRGTVAMRGRSGVIDCQVVHSRHFIVPSQGAASRILRHMSSRGRLRQRQFGVTGHLVPSTRVVVLFCPPSGRPSPRPLWSLRGQHEHHHAQ